MNIAQLFLCNDLEIEVLKVRLALPSKERGFGQILTQDVVRSRAAGLKVTRGALI